jgi:predicted O-methyltransferase YrrM
MWMIVQLDLFRGTTSHHIFNMFGTKILYEDKSIHTQLNEFDIDVIKEYAKKADDQYVEIGTAEGGSALIASEFTKVYTIDNGENLNLIKVDGPKIIKISGYSVEIAKEWDKPIKVLFIDGNHNKAREDYEAWKKHVVKGGYILFHDYIPNTEAMTVKKDLEGIEKECKIIFKPTKEVDTETRILIVQI